MRRLTPSGSRPTSTPSTVAVPDVGFSSPHSMRIVVDLPAPLRPEKPEDLPALDVEADADRRRRTRRIAASDRGRRSRASRGIIVPAPGRAGRRRAARWRSPACDRARPAAARPARRARRCWWPRLPRSARAMTRRASVARRDAASAAAIAALRRRQISAPLTHLDGRGPRRSRQPLLGAPRWLAAASATSAASAPAVEQRPVHFTPTSHDGFQRPVARKDSRVRVAR